MNIALPALVIILGLLPGIACFYGYFAGRFDKRNAGVSGVEELALYVVFAIPLNCIALVVCRLVGIDLDFDLVARLLSGTLSESAVPRIASTFGTNTGLSAGTYLTILLSGFLVGSIARRLVWAFRLDTRISVLRLRHAWYYVLQGRLRDKPRKVLAYVDVLTTHPALDPIWWTV